MKKSILFLGLVIGSLTVNAQASKYEQAIAKNVAALDTATSIKGLQVLLGSFERIAVAEKNKWQPYYYAGYCAVRLANFEKDLNLIDTKVDKAELLIQTANSLSPNNSEIYCLSALVAFTRIKVDFMSRGPKYSGLAHEALVQAQKLNPNNPRPYLLIGQSKFSTPPQFGGDKKVACQYFDKANALFATPPANALDPRWGKADAARYVATCQKLTAAAAEAGQAKK